MKNPTDIYGKSPHGIKLMVAPWMVRAMMKEVRPNVYMLMSAAWALGFTVNGITADG